MFIDELRAALIRMPETGDAGFEGLVATLLTALTGDRFHIARSGDQPADAVASAGDIAIQAKRYGKSRVDETNFEGEYSQACRLIPALDCYVFAVTREHAQLRLLAGELQQQEGVDIVLLGFDVLQSELPSLCVTFWERVKHFAELNKLGNDFAAWAASQAADTAVAATISNLRQELISSVPLAAMVRRRLGDYLDFRFGTRRDPYRAVRFPIDLASAVRREGPHLLLQQWWAAKGARAALLVGDEGMGKSVVAAAFAREVNQSASDLVLWLDSADWSGITSIDGLIDSGLKHAGFVDSKLRERLTRKAISRWSRRLLLVLDGVNEKGARETAHHLLADLGARGALTPRLLFTARNMQWHANERALWETATAIPVREFTDAELAAAMGTLSPPIPLDELPQGLVEVAKIPRYFKRAVELRGQLKSLRHVSREMVLWVDLLDKIQAGESQVIESIGWKSPADLKRAMTKLASAALRLPARADVTTDEYSVLQKSFDNFDQTRLDLAEQRIVLDATGEHPRVNRSHVILGFALHLGAIAADHGNEITYVIADRLRRKLEPLLSQDYLTESLFVALQLSALPGRTPYALTSQARAAFLFTWTSSQNSRVDDERLSFWAVHDPQAYLDFIEELFVEPVSDAWCSQVIEPLKRMWLAGAQPALEERLRKWLILVWRRDLKPEQEFRSGEYLLPVARSHEQLTLSNVALAILAENPIPTFLRDLAVAAATDTLSREEHHFTDQTGKDKAQDFPCKYLDNNLGPVLRWRFTESVKPTLEALTNGSPDDAVLSKGVRDLLISFDLFGWQWSGPKPETLRKRERLFPPEPGDVKNRFVDIPELAARHDLPDISADDEAIIAAKVEAAFASPQLRSDIYYSSAAMDLDHYLAWFAKYRPQRLAEIGATLRLAALGKPKAWLALDLANDLPYSRDSVSPAQLLHAAKELLRRIPQDTADRFDGSLLEAHVLALTCFGPRELQEWFTFAAAHKRARAHIHLLQVHVLCRYLPDEIALFAREQARRCCDEAPDESELSESEFDYWATIGGTAGPPDLNYHCWLDHELRPRRATRNRRFYWRLLWVRTAPDALLKKAVADGSMLELLGKEESRALLFANRTIEDWTVLTATIDQLFALPLDDVGRLLWLANRDVDLARWGHVIFAKALERVGHPPFERKFWGTTIFERDATGRIAGSNCDSEGLLPSEPQQEPLRPKPTSPHNYAKDFSIEERNRAASAALKVWRGDLHALHAIDDGALSQFNAFRALETWRDGQPTDFRRYTKELLTVAVERPGDAYHIGGFVSAAVDALVPLEPEFAYDIHSQLQHSSMRVTLINDYGASTFAAAMWRSAEKGNQRATALCRRLCEASTTDEEIARLAVVALAEGAEATLLSLCNDLLDNELAKERSLAVSLLAWVPKDTAINRLRELVALDTSGWIRLHAEWALEVAQHERAVRDFYRATLKVTDVNSVLSRLQVLLPALTLSATSWHRQIYDDELVEQHTPKEVEAALAAFWYNFRHRSSTPPGKIFNRDLREYLRGECIRDLRMPKPRLLNG